MEMALKVIGIAVFCLFLAYAVFENVWQRKKDLEKNSLGIEFAKLITFSILFLLLIPVLVIKVSLGQNYAIAIILLIASTVAISSLAFDIGKFKGKTKE